MMGRKKASEIKRELRQKFAGKATELNDWVKRRIAELQPDRKAGSRVGEELLWIRDLLRESLKRKKPRRNNAKRPRTRKATAS